MSAGLWYCFNGNCRIGHRLSVSESTEGVPTCPKCRGFLYPGPGVIAKEVVRELEANSLADIKRDIATLKEDVSGLKEDLAYVKSRVAGSEEIAVMNENIQALRERAGV